MKYKNKWDRFWNEPSPEGVSNKDGLLVSSTMIGMMLVFINLALWLAKPEQSWIGDFLFPLK